MERDYNAACTANQYAWQFVGVPYRWGGEHPAQGYDCSGFVQEILRSIGLIDDNRDRTAKGIYELFKDKEVDLPTQGCLAFYGKSRSKIKHVAWCINANYLLEAGGGGRKTNSLKAAIRHRAFVRMRYIDHQTVLCFIDPFMMYQSKGG